MQGADGEIASQTSTTGHLSRPPRWDEFQDDFPIENTQWSAQ